MFKLFNILVCSFLIPISTFGQGIFFFKENDKIGIKDYKGQVLFEPIFYTEPKFSEGIALARPGTDSIYVIDTGGILHFVFMQPEFRYEYKHKYSCGLIAIRDDETDLFGFKNLQNKWVIAPQFYEVNDFEENVALVWEDPNMDVDMGSGCGTSIAHEEWAFINKNGDYLTPKFKLKGKVENGLLIFEADKTRHIYNKSGEEIKVK